MQLPRFTPDNRFQALDDVRRQQIADPYILPENRESALLKQLVQEIKDGEDDESFDGDMLIRD